MSYSEVENVEYWVKVNDAIEVSNLGNIKSRGKILKGDISNKGYKRVHVSNNGQNYKLYHHQLVAQTFIPNPENKPCVNHIDGNKLNNKVDNLEWCTHSENLKHAYAIGLRSSKGESNTQAKLTEDDVRYIRKIYKKHDKLNNTYKLAKKYNVSPKCIMNIVNYKTWKHVV